MYCKNCGKEIDNNAYVCPNCGVLVKSAPTEVVAKKESNTKALIGFILSFFVPVVGLILGIMGLKASGEMKGEGKGMSIAAIIISAVGIVCSIIFTIVYTVALAAMM